MGRYYADYVDLLDHFDAVLPGRVHRVIHERLIDDLESEVHALLDYLDLPFEEACLHFYANDRAVRTASSEQVRRPINSDGVGQWRAMEGASAAFERCFGPRVGAISGGALNRLWQFCHSCAETVASAGRRPLRRLTTA